MKQGDQDTYPRYHPRMPRLALGIESKTRRVKKRVTKVDNNKELPKLISDLLELIAMRLDIVGFCAFGAVCKDWWEVYASSKQDFLESQAPMVVLISSYAKRACHLYDMANANTKKVMLPNFVGKSFVGCSIGYIIIEDMNHKISFINPLTGCEFSVQAPIFTLPGISHHDLIILIPTLPSRCYFVIAIANRMHEIRVFHSRRGCWFSKLNFSQRWMDAATFMNKVYIITSKARLGELRINESHCEIQWLEVKNAPIVNSQNIKLVVSNNQLLMVDFVPEERLSIQKMDFDSMEWVRIDNLGDQALFLGGKWGSTIRKPGKWKGQSNCVYYLETLSNKCCVYSMEARLMKKFSLVANSTTSYLRSHGWYYPHQCMMVDHLKDN